MPQKLIDQTTIQPDGRPGDDAFTAFATCNDNFEDAEQRLSALEGGSSNIGQDVANLKTGLQQETQLRTDADAAEATARQNADAALGARILGKNIVINGDFRFWQRGTGFNAAGYGADRFLNNINGITCSMTRLSLGVGEIAGFKYACRMSFNGGSDPAHYATLQHRMENLGYYSGKTLTFSGYMRANTAGLKVAFEVALGAGGGTIPGAVPISGIGVQTFTLGATWQRFTTTFTVPNLAGASLTDNSSLNFNLWLSAGSNHNSRNNNLGFQSGIVDFVGLQLEEGSIATTFEQRPEALEFALCQRFYEKSYDLNFIPGSSSVWGRVNRFYDKQGGGSTADVRFTVRKRATPVMAIYNDQTGQINSISAANGASGTVSSVINIGETGCQVNYTPATSWGAAFHYTADAEL
nr:hypothetical protein [Stenotrophomonas pavanii]